MGHYVTQTLLGDPNAMRRDLRSPQRYKAYVPTPLADLTYVPSAQTMERVALAGESCRALDTAIGASPVKMSRAMGLLSRSEGIGSATIENYTASMRRLVSDDATGETNHSTEASTTILRGIAATEGGLALLGDPSRDITPDDIEQVQGMLMSHFQNRFRGYRTDYVQIGGNEHRVASAAFIPPPADDVAPLVDDLCRYVNTPDGRHPLVRAAIAHAQFEIIHPFPDGNGRTGRVLMHSVLRREGLLVNAVAPISIAMSQDPDAYVDGLNSLVFEDGQFDPSRVDAWVGTFADFATQAAEQANTMLNEFETTYHRLAKSVGRTFREDSHALPLLNELSARLGVTTDSAAATLGISNEAARRLLSRMVDEGLVQQRRAGRTSVFFIDAMTSLVENAQAFRMGGDQPTAQLPTLAAPTNGTPRGRPRQADRCGHPLRNGGACMRVRGHTGPHRSKP